MFPTLCVCVCVSFFTYNFRIYLALHVMVTFFTVTS